VNRFVIRNVFSIVLFTMVLSNSVIHAMKADGGADSGETKRLVEMTTAVSASDAVIEEKEVTDLFSGLTITDGSRSVAPQIAGFNAWNNSTEAFNRLVDNADLAGVLQLCRVDEKYNIDHFGMAHLNYRSQFWAIFHALLKETSGVEAPDYAAIHEIISKMGKYTNEIFLAFAVAFSQDPTKIFPGINKLSAAALTIIKRCILLKLFTLCKNFSPRNKALRFPEKPHLTGYPLHIATTIDNLVLVHLLLATKICKPNELDRYQENASYSAKSESMILLLYKYDCYRIYYGEPSSFCCCCWC